MALKENEVMLYNVRAAFLNVYQPSKERTDKKTGEKIAGQYSGSALMEKGTDQTKKNMAAVKKASDYVKEKKWGSNQPKLKPEKVCMRDGDLEDYDGFENHFYVSANNKEQPVLITKHKDDDGKWIPAKPGQLYSGCYVNMLVSLWAQDNEHGKRVNATLEAVQFVRKGEAFAGGGPIDAEEKFAMIEADQGEDFGGEIGSSDDEDDVV